MAKITFPAAGKPYRGFISELRTWFQLIASYVTRNPAAATEINEQIGALAAVTGYVTVLPGTQAVVSDGQILPVTGGTVTLAVAAGVVTATYTPE